MQEGGGNADAPAEALRRAHYLPALGAGRDADIDRAAAVHTGLPIVDVEAAGLAAHARVVAGAAAGGIDGERFALGLAQGIQPFAEVGGQAHDAALGAAQLGGGEETQLLAHRQSLRR